MALSILSALLDTPVDAGIEARQRSYQEYAPPPHLRDFVVCFWRREAGAGTVSRRVLPDGCVDIIWVGEREPFVTGPMTVAVRPAIDGTNAIAGVRFRPGVAPAL